MSCGYDVCLFYCLFVCCFCLIWFVCLCDFCLFVCLFCFVFCCFLLFFCLFVFFWGGDPAHEIGST